MEEQSQTLEVMLSQSELNQEILAGLMEEVPMESNFNAPINQDTGAIGSNNNNIIPDVDDGLRHVYIKNSEDTPEKLIAHAHPVKRMAELESKIGKYKNYDNFEDILRHLGKNVIGSGNHIFIVKLLVALISNLPKEAVNEEYITNILTTSTISNSSHP